MPVPILACGSGGAACEAIVTASADEGANERTRLRGLRGKLIVSVALALMVLIGLSLFADGRKLAHALRDFRWELLPVILLLTLTNYALRFVKWQYYLRRIGISGLPTGLSARIYLSGFAMAVTPGKVGEVLKSVLLREATGTPIATTAPIVLAERLTDGIAMMLLASAGLIVFHYGVPLFAGIAVVATLAFILIGRQSLIRGLITRGERVPLVARFVHHLHAFYDSTYWLLRSRPLIIASALGVVSWLMECIAFFLVLIGLGFEVTPRLLLIATFILGAASVVGAISLLPGGLGAAEIGVTAMLLALVTSPLMTHDVAVAATLLIRFCTLWFGVGIGVVALVTVRGLLRGERRAPATTLAGAVPHGD
jgi:uncharacterized protein (TIRG00374 family)